jgi:uncharacterized protein YaiI (UPF0178 family)
MFEYNREGESLTITAPVSAWLRRDEQRFADELDKIISQASGEYIDELQGKG